MEYYPPPPTQSSLRGGHAPGPDRSSKLMIREYPHRAIAIVSHSHVLIFRHSHTTSEAIANGSLASVSSARGRQGETAASKCMVEFAPVSKHILSDYRPLTPRPIYGTLGLISINQDVFLCVVTQASRAVATLRPGETIDKILMVEFFCLSSSEYDHVLSSNPMDISDSSSAYGPGLSKRDVELEHPCQKLQEILGNGSFYYSSDVDLTNRLQDRPADATTFDIDNFDEGFLWNSFMISPLVEFRSRLQEQEREALDASRILTSAIRGFCSTMTIPQQSAPLRATRSGMPSYLTVISRLSCKRAGTRFNARGIDDDGNVANFVETETVFWSPSGVVFSYAQVRGSVPVFFEQAANLTNQQKITVTRSHDAAQPAFDKHFEELEHAYGAVHVVNLLSAEKAAERELTMHYRMGLKNSRLAQQGEKSSRDHALLRATEFDFHAETRGPTGYEAAQQIRRYIEDSAEGFAYYLAEETDDPPEAAEKTPAANHHRFVVVLQQEGVFRTNCLDCLDRTNLIQTIISQMAIEAFLGHRGEYPASDFLMRHSSLWADNGDSLSRIYAGTGALKSSFTRHGKMSIAGAFADMRKSATRMYIQNFVDSGRQNTIDLLLGRIYGQLPVVLFDPISDFVASELNKRAAEFSSTEVIDIWVGTFNLNGRTEGVDEDLSPWLWPDVLGDTLPELVVVGFQEIVELSPQQIMNSDPRRRKLWEASVARTLNSRAKAHGEAYVPLRSGQLVGAALCIFVKSSALHHIKNVESNVKKTGMSGIAGNKGAVAIRLDYANTPMCFVTAHLAAGFGNYDERNRDYAMIHQGLRFQRNRGIDDHSTVIWLGDFNYRIGLSREAAMDLVKKHDLERLYENDQLNLQMVAGLAFRFYSESRIRFLPTYRFDIGKDEYDSSEKQRIPAWTDRILRKGPNIQQQSYNSAPLKFSDHRPVYATFRCIVNIVNEPLRDKIASDIYDRRKVDVGEGVVDANTDDTDDEELLGYDAIEPGLPPASSDRQKWWLDNGKMAKSAVQPPKPSKLNQTVILNPKRPSNPFVPTEESDWVEVPRLSESYNSDTSGLSTSPYEHVNLSTHSISSISSRSSQQVPRKLPPPYDPSAFVNNKPVKKPTIHDAIQTGTSQQRQETPPPPPPPRRQTGLSTTQTLPPPVPIATRPRISTMPQPATTSQLSHAMAARKPVAVLPPPSKAQAPASTGSSDTSQSTAKVLSKKPPPPTVARKPAHLSGLTPEASPKMSQGSFSGSATASPASSAQRHVGGYVSDREGAPPKLPQRSMTETIPTRSAAERASLGDITEGERRPNLPARKPIVVPPVRKAVAGASKAGQNVDLLGDDGPNGQMASWQALKPT